MRARRIIQAGAFAPDDVARLQTAFDLAWDHLRSTIETPEQSRAREALAIIVVSAGTVSGLDAEELAAFAERTYEAVWSASRTT